MACPVVLTGPSRGIGRATALQLAARGAELWLLGRPSPALDETLALCQAKGGQHRIVACDVADPKSIEAAAHAVLDQVVPRALINNAGVVTRARLEDVTLADYHRQLDTNLLGPLWLCRALMPALRSTGNGRIVNVSSISAVLGTAGQTVYNASKWALSGFTKSLAEELRDSGVSVVAVLPGAVDTDMLQGSGFPPRMTANDVGKTIVHYALDAPLAHNGGIIEMFGV